MTPILQADQEMIVLGTIFNSQYTFFSIANILRPDFFENKAFGVLYHTLQQGKTKYNKLLTAQELWAELTVTQDMSRTDLRDAFMLVSGYKQGPGVGIDQGFAIQQIENFIRKRLLQGTIHGVVNRTLSKQDIDWGQIEKEIRSLNVAISQQPPTLLTDFDAVYADAMTATTGNILESSIPGLNHAFSYKGYNKKSLFQYVAAPGVGKSTLMTNESCAFAIAGHNVAHIVLGDLTRYDLWIRILSRLFCDEAHSQSNLIRMSRQQIEADIAANNFDGRFNRIAMLAYPAASISAAALKEEVFKIKQDCFGGKLDAVIIDYADNLQAEHESMYVSGGEIYTQLEKMVWDLNLVGITASQPKPQFWDEEILKTQNAAAESGKKHHIIDASFNIGKPTRLTDGSSVCAMFLAKMRRGAAHRTIFLRIFYGNCLAQEISMDEYLRLKKEFAVGKVDDTQQPGPSGGPGASAIPTTFQVPTT